MPTIYLLGLGWANGWVLFECAYYLPAGYEPGELFQNPQLTHNVPTGYIALRPQWKEVYISNIECMLADLSGRVSEMEGKLCRCHKEDIEVAEVKDDNDPTLELSYETVYHTPVAIAGLLEDVPNRLVPLGDLEITRGGFEEEVRDRDEDSDQRLESVALQVAERVLEEEDENDKQVACISRYCLSNELTFAS